MAKGSIASTVAALVEETVKALGYSLWDVEYKRVGADYHLEITIDSPEGITSDDCETVSRAVDPLLDEADPISDFYYLDVSSPGLERELRTDMHLRACTGQRVEAKLYRVFEGSKAWRGVLSDFTADTVTLTDEGGAAHAIPREDIARLHTVFFD